MNRIVLLLLLSMLLAPLGWANVPVTLKGSRASMLRQNEVATDAGYTFVESAAELDVLVARGELVVLEGNADFEIHPGVSAPMARPELRLFIERLAAQYREATGEKLMVTSLTRTSDGQPRNAHTLSVHPAGIAVDLRVSRQRKSRQWLESALLGLERQGLLDITRERRPPHYHVALFPEAYAAHVEGMIGAEALAFALAGPQEEEEMAAEQPEATQAVQPEKVMATATPITGAEGRKIAASFLLVLVVVTVGATHLAGRRSRRPAEEEVA